MKNLIDINDLEYQEIVRIWQAVGSDVSHHDEKSVAWSFEGNGIRTRTTFIQAFQRLQLAYVELPNFLKTAESVKDLAGYMDAFYALYVIRENNHPRLAEFAAASSRPVINAMSSEAHPCEVLTDAYYLNSKYHSLNDLNILLWGPLTNVFKSWYSLASVMGLNVAHYCPKEERGSSHHIAYPEDPIAQYNVVITDAWPTGFSDPSFSLTLDSLDQMASPELLPTPPVTQGREVSFNPSVYKNFSGYDQKQLLLPVQMSIISWVLGQHV